MGGALALIGNRLPLESYGLARSPTFHLKLFCFLVFSLPQNPVRQAEVPSHDLLQLFRFRGRAGRDHSGQHDRSCGVMGGALPQAEGQALQGLGALLVCFFLVSEDWKVGLALSSGGFWAVVPCKLWSRTYSCGWNIPVNFLPTIDTDSSAGSKCSRRRSSRSP